MTLITDKDALSDFCRRLSGAETVTVDTEFIRDTTFWPKLCLVQVAGPQEAAAIDPLAPGMELAPLFGLLADPAVLKVFHAARQDLEIFLQLAGRLPAPVFDTQVAAMVCGFGDQVSYEKLAGKLAGARIDKSARFADWSRRPLSRRQLDYALSDVTHLRKVHRKLERRLAETGRRAWLAEEMASLTDPATYDLEPENAWRRLKTRSRDRRYLAVLHRVAAWREREAQRRDVPRNRVLRDEQLYDLAAQQPTTAEALSHTRGLSADFARSRLGRDLLQSIEEALALPEELLPQAPVREATAQEAPAPLVELLRVLLKVKCEEHGVAQRLVASSGDLEQIALDDAAPVPALHGWRRELFGQEALALKHGRLALAAAGERVRLVALPKDG